MSVVDDVFKRQLLFNVYDSTKEGKGLLPRHWESRFKEFESDGLIYFKLGYWLTEEGKKYISAI